MQKGSLVYDEKKLHTNVTTSTNANHQSHKRSLIDYNEILQVRVPLYAPLYSSIDVCYCQQNGLGKANVLDAVPKKAQRNFGL